MKFLFAESFMLRQYELVELVKSYDPDADESALNRAYVFAVKAHGSQTRDSGDPYFSHPIQVAGILTEMKLDTATIITALLHDTVEDTDITLEDIESNFGKEVRDLVDGVTKLSQIEMSSKQQKQAENFRKLVLAMSNDIRVLLVKLADRLHNMRTLHYIASDEKRKRISCETMEIYAPLAGRIGIHHFKDELQDLAFMHINPEARQSIISRLQFLRSEDEDKVSQIIDEMMHLLQKNGLKATVTGREKRPYSIWEKMQRKNITFEQLSDIMAFRINVDSISECYQALGIVHSAYRVVPDRFKDYISTPKPNGYQSIHTTVYGPRNHRVEIQIRTESMHYINEYGVSAHWQYKQQGETSNKDGHQYRWLRGLLDILENASDPEDFLEHTKLEMFQDQVFCFTPNGDLITLPQGATPIDFAYSIHSEVGNHCVGARINGRMAPLKTILKNGDQVEITTAKAQSPSPSWERYTVTGKAKASIRRFVRSQKRAQFITLGHSVLQKIFKNNRIILHEKDLEAKLEDFGCKELDDLYALIGEGLKNPTEIMHHIYPAEVRPKEGKITRATRTKKTTTSPISIKGLIPGMAIHYAGCCHPLPGDNIVGVMQTGRGVTIHTNDCDNLKQYKNESDRIFDLTWNDNTQQKEKFIGRLHIIALHKVGSMANIATLIGKNDGNIMNFKVIHRTDTFFEFLLDLEVNDISHMKAIMANLRSSDYVNSVERQAH